MKKTMILSCVVLLLIIMASGCGQDKVSQQSHTKITYFHADWPYYETLDFLTNAAENVFEGKVTNIFFDVLDMRTGEPIDKSDDPLFCRLYTIYEVDVTNSYKGTHNQKVYIQVIGGIAGFKETEQSKVLKEAGIFDELVGILVLEAFKPLNIGSKYLFLTNNRATENHTIINDTQFAFEVNNAEKRDIFTYEQVKSYVNKESRNR